MAMLYIRGSIKYPPPRLISGKEAQIYLLNNSIHIYGNDPKNYMNKVVLNVEYNQSTGQFKNGDYIKDMNNIRTSVHHELDKESFPVSPEIVQTSSFCFKDYQHY